MAAKGEVGGEEEEDEGGGEEEEGAGRQILVELFHWIPCENRCGLWSAGVFVLQRKVGAGSRGGGGAPLAARGELCRRV